MPVLVTTYHEAFLHKGGGEYELLEVAFNLRRLGLVVDVYSPFARDIEAYDAILHFSLVPETLPLLHALKDLGKRIILWPNFWSAQELPADRQDTFRRFFRLADAVVFKSQAEADILAALVPDSCRLLTVPAGIDPCFAAPAPVRLFRDSYELDEYLLWIGIIEPSKNQLQAVNALRRLDVPMVFVGNYRDRAYYDACQNAAPDRFHFLPPLAHKSDMLRAALRECAAYLELGRDPGGKSVLEAAISGARIVIPRSSWAEEHFGDFPTYVNPDDEASIVRGVSEALEKAPDADMAARLMARHGLPDVLLPLRDYIIAKDA